MVFAEPVIAPRVSRSPKKATKKAAPPRKDPSPVHAIPTDSGPSEQEIATCAYLIWKQEGCPQGRDKIHWEQARAQLIACSEHDVWLAAWCSLLANSSDR